MFLFRKNQECYAHAGGFLEDDDEQEERRERIAEARQKRKFLLDSIILFKSMVALMAFLCPLLVSFSFQNLFRSV